MARLYYDMVRMRFILFLRLRRSLVRSVSSEPLTAHQFFFSGRQLLVSLGTLGFSKAIGHFLYIRLTILAVTLACSLLFVANRSCDDP